jgi:uncharacterized protein
MQQQITLKLLPSEAASDGIIKEYISNAAGKPVSAITGFVIKKKSLDARGKQVWVNLTLLAYIEEPFTHLRVNPMHFKDAHHATHKVIIIGAGPCGLFAALKLISEGIQPVILERGKDIRSRRRDLALLNKEGIINPDSNYCFGEGGAGTYSDGKLYTRSNKRGNIDRIINLFVQFGADENILYEAHPHIGTNKLPHIITAMREQIISCGGIFLFQQKVTDFILKGNNLAAVRTATGDTFEAAAFILATGHSARDIFHLLEKKKLLIEAKPFALGVRIEHPQLLIDSIQYHCSSRGPHLPPASYGLVEQVNQHGVFSFCMCPGGIIAPAATNPLELVVNGWSPSRRNNPYANSGMVCEVKASDLTSIQHWTEVDKGINDTEGPLAMMHFQQAVERRAFQWGGGKFVAPAQRMDDFINKKQSTSLPNCSYLPGIHSADLHEVLPGFIYEGLKDGFKAFGKKMRGYLTNEAVVVATESRTSSPVRVPRHEINLCHPQVANLYPAGEGAGYAGGIVSAAMDGERVATMLVLALGVDIQ